MSDTLQEFYDRIDALPEESDAEETLAIIKAYLEGFEATHGKGSLEYAAALNEAGSVCRGQSRYQEAEQYFTDAVKIISQTEGMSSPEYATALMNLAGVMRINGKATQSIDLFKTAMDIYANTLGVDSIKYLTAINNLALSYQDLGDYELAVAHHIDVCKALDERGENSIEYATSLYNTGYCFKELGENKLGNELLEKALNLYESLLPDGHPFIVHTRDLLKGK